MSLLGLLVPAVLFLGGLHITLHIIFAKNGAL